MSESSLPAALVRLQEDFLALAEPERLELLMEYADELPDVPDRLRETPGALERVVECRSPVYIAVEADAEGRIALHATAPPEAPTTRGFASLLVHAVTGLQAAEVAAIPADYAASLGLGHAVSPLRLAGMAGMIARVARRAAAVAE